MNITPEIIENHGFVKINNSTWRKDNITLQSKWVAKNYFDDEKAYRVCVNGKFIKFIETDTDFYQFINKNIKL